jgi:hypothetical protein
MKIEDMSGSPITDWLVTVTAVDRTAERDVPSDRDRAQQPGTRVCLVGPGWIEADKWSVHLAGSANDGGTSNRQHYQICMSDGII